ncbi:hypothetical protein AAG906_010384 [Vitis piasezkii]
MDVSLESKILPSVGNSRKSYLQVTSQRLARGKLVHLNGRRSLALPSVGPVKVSILQPKADFMPKTSTDSILLWKELPPGMLLIDVLLRSSLCPLQYLVQMRGAILDALFRISKGFYFSPHHLIMAALLHFEEKDEPPTETVPPASTTPTTILVLETTTAAPPTTLATPPAASSTSEAFMTISATEFCAMVHTFEVLTTTHNAIFQKMEVMRAQLDQHTPDIPGPSEPIAPAEDATTVEAPIQPT